MRLDLFLFQEKYVKSRTNAQNLIKLNKVLINGVIVNKPSYDVSNDDKIILLDNYDVNLGSLKISNIVHDFNLNLTDYICLDLGCSNGGFTNYLLKNGAKLVYCVDIGPNQFDEALTNDSRTIIMDNTNARYLKKDDFIDSIDFITIDLSFISLSLILPVCYNLIEYSKEIVALIKPQFELEKKDLNNHGIVKSKKLEKEAIDKIVNISKSIGFKVNKVIEAPHPFNDKNQEYFIYLTK